MLVVGISRPVNWYDPLKELREREGRREGDRQRQRQTDRDRQRETETVLGVPHRQSECKRMTAYNEEIVVNFSSFHAQRPRALFKAT